MLAILLGPLDFLLSNRFKLFCFPTTWLEAYLINVIAETHSACEIRYLRFLCLNNKPEFKVKKRQMCFIYFKREVIINKIFKNPTDAIDNLQTLYDQFLYLQSQLYCVSLTCKCLTTVLIAFTKFIRAILLKGWQKSLKIPKG